MKRITAIFLLALLASCATLDNSPPKYIFQAWSKHDAKTPEIKDDMQSCGYKDTRLANDLSNQDIAIAENCMKSKGYVLDTSSYKPDNCYGPNSPYLCNKFWGGKKPVPTPVRAQDQ